MRKYKRPLWAAAAVVMALAVAACGSSGSSSSSSGGGSSSTSSSSSGTSSGKTGGTATVVEGTFPQSLDPSIDFTTQGGEVHWLTYLGPYSFAHASGQAGTQIIPSVAEALPTVSDGGKTYTFTIRKGLKYSDGTPVKASDLTFGVERALKLGWSAASFLTTTIDGASDYAKGKAKTVSGIVTDNSTGKTTIHLAKPYGAFVDVLAVPGVSYMPTTTPMKPEPNSPPAGFGPYVIKNVEPNVGFDLEINPTYAAQAIPGIPAGKMNVHVKVESNTTTEASDVLNNSADVFDWGDTIPPALIQQVSGMKDRYKAVQSNKTFYWFLNVTEKPFSSQLAREAVDIATDRPALARLGSGALVPGCFLLPPAMVGHPTGTCPYWRPELVAGRGEGQAARAAVGHGRSGRHRLGAEPSAAPSVGGELRRHAERDRVQGDAQDDRGRGLLLDDRDAQEPPPDRLRRLAAGFPEPDRLLPEPGRRERDPAGGELELRGGQRPAHPVGAGEALPGAGQPAGHRGVAMAGP